MNLRVGKKLRNTIVRRAFAALLALGCISGTALSQESDALAQERQKVIEEMNKMLLGTSGTPLPLDAGRGWKGVVLAPPGTALSSLMTPFDAFGGGGINVATLLENVNTFDRPLFVSKGLASPGPMTLAQAWEAVIEATRPEYVAPTVELENDPELKWLFRQADDVDRARGVVYLREPSTAMVRYREYSLTFQALIGEESKNSGFWRMDPRLSKFGSLQEAKASVLEDWISYGYKREVEQAQAVYKKKSGSREWAEWSTAKSLFASNRTYISPETWVPFTIVFPPPSEWLGMGAWVRCSVGTKSPNIIATFQLARVRIIREWFGLDRLLDGRLKLRRDAGSKFSAGLSDGKLPTSIDYPRGILAVVPEEFLLVRNIRFIAKDVVPERREPGNALHPLSLFAYPDEINLLGYVVRAIPKVEK